jgi:hypothetical protein
VEEMVEKVAVLLAVDDVALGVVEVTLLIGFLVEELVSGEDEDLDDCWDVEPPFHLEVPSEMR